MASSITDPNYVINVSTPPAQVVVSQPSVASTLTGEAFLDPPARPTYDRPFKRLLGRETLEIRNVYEFGAMLGRGSTSIVRKVFHKQTKEVFACKSISKAKLTRRQDVEDMKKEIEVMFHLRGHENIVELHDVFEDRNNVHLVMDLCTGGELFDHIIAAGSYTEQDAAKVMRTILTVVAHCHNMGVIHRDIKPENFLWTDDKFTTLKAIDFGLSNFYRKGTFFRDLVGSKYYVAPEVLRRSYTNMADIWSCGVVMFMLLTGYPPFLGDTLHDVFDNILKGELSFEEAPWPEISDAGKDCIQKMLIHQPNRRWTAQKLLSHEWINEHGVAPNKVISGVQTRVREFAGMNRLQQVARKVIAENLPMDEIAGLSNMFNHLDADHNGNISADELRSAMAGKSKKMPIEEFDKILQAADMDGNGIVSYKEFLAATLSAANVTKEEHLLQAFEHFDKDNSGFITREELMEALKGYGVVENLEQILSEVDRDGNGIIDYEEFRRAILGY